MSSGVPQFFGLPQRRKATAVGVGVGGGSGSTPGQNQLLIGDNEDAESAKSTRNGGSNNINRYMPCLLVATFVLLLLVVAWLLVITIIGGINLGKVNRKLHIDLDGMISDAVQNAAAAAGGGGNGGAAAAIAAYRRWISDYRAGIANGTIKPMSDSEKAIFQKLVVDYAVPALGLDTLKTGDSAEFNSTVGQAVSDYLHQRAVSLGLVVQSDSSQQQQQTRATAPLPADYGVDCDNDGIDDFAAVFLPDYLVTPALPANPFDMSTPGVSIKWTPSGAAGGYQYNLAYSDNVPLVSTAGHTVVTASFVPNRDDGYVSTTLNHAFYYSGTSWTQAFMISNGLVAFGTPAITRFGNPHNPGRFLDLPQPVINPLSSDLDFFCGGDAYFYSDATKTVFTWSNVPLWIIGAINGCPVSSTNTFQLILYAGSNAFEFRYGAVDSANIGSGLQSTDSTTGAFMGSAFGHGPSPVTYLDLSRQNTYSAGSPYTLGSAFEWWSPAHGEDIRSLGQAVAKFLQTWPSHFDHVWTMSFGWGISDGATRNQVTMQGADFFFSSPVQVPSVGTGFFSTQVAGVGAEMETVIWLRMLEAWFGWTPTDLLEGKLNKKFGLGQSQTAPIHQKTQFSPSGTTFGQPLLYNLATNGASSGYTNGDFVVTSLWDVLSHELVHKWIAGHNLRWPGDPSQWGYHWLQSRTCGGCSHKSAFMDSRLDPPSPWGDTDFKYGAPKRPRGDTNHYSHGHITPLIPDPSDSNYFLDALDHSIRYPDNTDYLMTWAYQSCADRGLQLFVSTPQSLRGGISPMSLGMAGVIPWTSLANRTQFIVDTPQSINPYYAWFDLNQLGEDASTWMNNMLYCGNKVDIPMTNFFNITDVAYSQSVIDVFGSVAPQADFRFNARAPLIGDEGDFVDMTAATGKQQALYNALNLAQYPINNTGCELAQRVDSYLYPQLAQTRCVDVKTIAPVLLIRPGAKLTPQASQTMCNAVKMLRDKSATHLFSGYGARGRVGDVDYIPKYQVGLLPLFRSRN